MTPIKRSITPVSLPLPSSIKKSPFACSTSDILALGLGPPPPSNAERLSRSVGGLPRSPMRSPSKRNHLTQEEDSEDEEWCPRKKSAFDAIELSEFHIAEKEERKSPRRPRHTEPLPLLSARRRTPLLSKINNSDIAAISDSVSAADSIDTPPHSINTVEILSKRITDITLSPDLLSGEWQTEGKRKSSNPFLLSAFPIGSTCPHLPSSSPPFENAFRRSTNSNPFDTPPRTHDKQQENNFSPRSDTGSLYKSQPSPDSNKISETIFNSPFTNSILTASISSNSSMIVKEPTKVGRESDDEWVDEDEEGWQSDGTWEGEDGMDVEEKRRVR